MGRRPLVAAVVGVGLVAVLAVLLTVGLVATGHLSILGAGGGHAAPRFVDETASSGLAFTYDGPFDFAVGGGVAAFDCDGDGRPELYVAGGAGPGALFHNDSVIGGSLRFTRIASPVTDLTGVTGAYPIDVDGDGNTDLVLLRNGENVVLRGLGGCRFERANEAWGLAGASYHTMAFAATWERGSRWPTVAFGDYVDQSIADVSQWCEPNQLFRPASAGAAGWGPPIALKSWCTQSLLFSDWSRSGRPDLRVSNDRHYYRTTEGEEQLWRMEPEAAPREYGLGDGWQVVQVEGMGIASRDLNADGYPEVYLTSQAANRLQTLTAGPSQPTYGDIGASRHADVPHPFTGDTTLPSTSWDPLFGDVNNDGLVDLLVTKGNITDQPDFAQRDPSDLLLGQPDGTFQEAADQAGIVRFERGRGAALVDLNLDGRLDLVEVFYGAPVEVWRNAGPVDGSSDGHWLQLRLAEDGPNRDAIGSWLEVRFGGQVVQQEVTIGGGHAGGQLGWLHVGLGSADSAQVRVQWPDGQWGPEQVVAADTFATIQRGAAAPIPWTPGG